MTATPHSTRLLPWSTPDGNPCYLSTDGTGYVSRIADAIESVQLGMAGELLDHTANLLTDDKATRDQLRFALSRMSEALRDVKRIADSRGARLPLPDSEFLALDDEDIDEPRLPGDAFE